MSPSASLIVPYRPRRTRGSLLPRFDAVPAFSALLAAHGEELAQRFKLISGGLVSRLLPGGVSPHLLTPLCLQQLDPPLNCLAKAPLSLQATFDQYRNGPVCSSSPVNKKRVWTSEEAWSTVPAAGIVCVCFVSTHLFSSSPFLILFLKKLESNVNAPVSRLIHPFPFHVCLAHLSSIIHAACLQQQRHTCRATRTERGG